VVWLSLIPTGLWVRSTAVGSETNLDQYIVLVGFSIVIPACVMLVHTTLAVLRSRMSNADELLGVVPVGPDRRSVAHGLSALAASAVALMAIVIAYLVLRPGSPIGAGDGYIPRRFDVPRPNVAQLLQGPVAVAVVLSLALAIVRWIPSWIVIVPLAFLMFVQGIFLGIWFGVPSGDATWWWPLATGVVHGEWMGSCETDGMCVLLVGGFDRVTPWWHLAYLVALTVWFVIIAVLRHRRDRAMWTSFVASLGLVLALAIIQLVVSVEYATPPLTS
jgi:hypothetical protein